MLAHEPALSRQFLEERQREREKGTSGAKPVRFFPDEGLVDPQMAVEHLVEKAQSQGAKFIFGARVRGYPWDMEGDVTGVCFAQSGREQEEVKADVVVLANGTGTARLAKAAGVRVPLLHKPGVLTWLRSANLQLSKIVVSQDLHFLQRPDGLIAVGESKETGGASSVAFSAGQVVGLKAQGLSAGAGLVGEVEKEIDVEQPDGEVWEEEASVIGARMLASARLIVPGLSDAEVVFVSRGHRPMPEDGLPIAGFSSNICSTRSPSLYVAVCHSKFL